MEYSISWTVWATWEWALSCNTMMPLVSMPGYASSWWWCKGLEGGFHNSTDCQPSALRNWMTACWSCLNGSCTWTFRIYYTVPICSNLPILLHHHGWLLECHVYCHVITCSQLYSLAVPWTGFICMTLI
jgi:hypothetical protein